MASPNLVSTAESSEDIRVRAMVSITWIWSTARLRCAAKSSRTLECLISKVSCPLILTQSSGRQLRLRINDQKSESESLKLFRRAYCELMLASGISSARFGTYSNSCVGCGSLFGHLLQKGFQLIIRDLFPQTTSFGHRDHPTIPSSAAVHSSFESQSFFIRTCRSLSVPRPS